MEKRLKIFNFKILTSWVLYREMMVWCVYNEKKKRQQTIYKQVSTTFIQMYMEKLPHSNRHYLLYSTIIVYNIVSDAYKTRPI